MPTGAEIKEHTGRCMHEGHAREAEQLYWRVLQSHPGDAAALHALGVIAYQSGNHQRAIELIGKAIANDPQRPEFRNTLGLVFETLGEFEQATAAYENAVSLRPDYAEAMGRPVWAILPCSPDWGGCWIATTVSGTQP